MFAVRSAHIADVHIDLAAVTGNAGGAGALPHIAGNGAGGHVVVGVPDVVVGQLAHIQPLAEPGGGGVHAGLVAQCLDLFAESHSTLGAVFHAQTIGTAIACTGSLGIKVDGVIELAAIQHIDAGLCFLAGLVLVDGLAEAVDAHPQPGVAGVGEVLLKLGVLHQRAGAVAAVAYADDGKLHTCRFHLVPIDAALVLGNIDAEGGGLLHAGGIKIIELVVDALDAGDGLVSVLVVVIGLAVFGAPAGILGRFFLILAEEELPQPLQQAVFTGQAGGVDALFVQRAAVQCIPDLLRGQQNGAVDILDLGFGQHILAVLGSGRRFLGYGGGLLRFGQDGGLFRSSTPEDPTEQVSQEATTEEAKTTAVSETTISQKEVYMPKLVGHSQDEAEKILQGLDLSMQVEQENSDGVEKGMVISQKEEPDTVIPRFSKVTVVISAGSDKVDLAELGLSGMTLETAVRLLEGKNLKADVQEESSEDVPSGTIIRYEPEDKVALGSTVTLYVSTGPEEEFVSVPNLYGKTDAEASVLLSAAGLVAGEISKEYDSTISAGHVISQGVEAGTQVAPGETVDYTVSLGPEAPKKQFIASLDASYPLQVSYGPGAASSEIQILIRLKQTVNGKVTYTKLAEPKSYSADTTLNIKLDKIRGADGVQTGEVEIVDLTNNVVLTSYNVTFTEVDS